VVKTSLPNCAMTHLAFVSTIGGGQVDRRCDQFELRTIGHATLNDGIHSPARISTFLACNPRLNLADVDVRRGGERLKAETLMIVGFLLSRVLSRMVSKAPPKTIGNPYF